MTIVNTILYYCNIFINRRIKKGKHIETPPIILLYVICTRHFIFYTHHILIYHVKTHFLFVKNLKSSLILDCFLKGKQKKIICDSLFHKKILFT